MKVYSPGVPPKAALAPVRVNKPPSLRYFVAKWLEIVDVHMLCFHIKSAFLYRALRNEITKIIVKFYFA